MKKLPLTILLVLLILNPPNSHAQSTDSSHFTDGQLAQMLAPIALYPDTLLTHILIASTYPIEIVEAHRWLVKHENVSSEQLFNQVADKDWDPSIKALLPFPRVLKRLNDDLTWTNELGDAFLADETQVLSSIQQLRQQADQAGNLEKMENMSVNYEDDNIVIQPAQPEIVYVPYYDSRTIYGYWNWHYYPPVYWSYPRHYVSHRPYYWHSGVHISFNYFFSAFHWHSRHLVVVNHHNSHRYVQRRRIVSSHGSKRWHHQPQHRRGVAYSNNHVKKRYSSNRVSRTQSKINRNAHKQLVAQQSKTTAKSRYNSEPSIKHNKTVKKLNHVPMNKSSVNKPVNHHNKAKVLNKPVASNKMRQYKVATKQRKTTQQASNKTKRSYKSQKNKSSNRHNSSSNQSKKHHSSASKHKSNR